MKAARSEIKRIIKAFGYSWQGIKAAFKSEPAFRIEVAAAPVFVIIALCMDFGITKKALLIATIFLVLMAELVNTAIETIVDRIAEEQHPLSGKAKDVGSAIVLLALLNAATVWGMIFFG